MSDSPSIGEISISQNASILDDDSKAKACSHSNTKDVFVQPTCLKVGHKDIVCVDCETVLFSMELPATGHKFVKGICEYCLEVERQDSIDSKADESNKINDSKNDESKTNESQIEDSKQNDSKLNESKVDESRQNESKNDESDVNESRKNESKSYELPPVVLD